METTSKPRVWLDIDLQALRANFDTIAAKVRPLSVMVVLKANAYGLGIQRIAEVLRNAGAAMIGVAELREALPILHLKIPVQILGGLIAEEIPAVVAHGIVATITNLDTARLLSDEAMRRGAVVPCHLLIDTGMGRLGILERDAIPVAEAISDLPGLACIGIFTHFPHAYADITGSNAQVRQFIALVATLEQRGITYDCVHIANSDGINNIGIASGEPFTMVRTGINLYGIFDTEGMRSLDLRPVFTLKARLISVRKLTAGSSIGYGRTCLLERDSVVGTVAVGYADGLPLAMSNNGSLIVRGQQCPVLGRVSMDYTTVSLDTVPGAAVGDEVTCLRDGTDVGAWAGYKDTNPYEVICSIGNRVERCYVDDNSTDPRAGSL